MLHVFKSKVVLFQLLHLCRLFLIILLLRFHFTHFFHSEDFQYRKELLNQFIPQPNKRKAYTSRDLIIEHRGAGDDLYADEHGDSLYFDDYEETSENEPEEEEEAETGAVVADLKIDLTALEPILKVKGEEAVKMIAVVTEEQAKAEVVQTRVELKNDASISLANNMFEVINRHLRKQWQFFFHHLFW